MELRDLVRAILSGNLLAARQWVADAQRAHLQWDTCALPGGLDERELSVAAGLVELLAARAGERAPAWTATIGAAQTEPLFLDPGLAQMPRTLERTKRDAPEVLRRRNLFASPDFLEIR
jgi:hypothetical protein